jgi:outer membrane protein OmpA-like peptidoglycan-associated protein
VRSFVRRAALTLFSLVAFSCHAAAQSAVPNSIPGMNPKPFPMLGVPLQSDSESEKYRRLPYRDLANEIRIELAADALYDFDRGEVPASAADYMQQAANLIFERAKGPVHIECHSDRGPPAGAQKLAERCTATVIKWLIEQEKLTKVKFVTGGTSPHPPAAAIASALPAPAAARVSQSNISIVFATR